MDRQTAKLLGLTRYDGAVCSKNPAHGTERFQCNKACAICHADERRAWRSANRESECARMRVYRSGADFLPKRRIRDARYRTRLSQDPARLAERDERERLAVIKRDEARESKRRRAAALKALKEAEGLSDAALAERAAREAERLAKSERLRAAAVITNRLKQKRRRALKRGAAGGATEKDVLRLLRLQRGACAYCGDTGDLHLDHKVPVSREGDHSLPNLQFLCAAHNLSKRDWTDAEYREANGIPAVTIWDAKFVLSTILVP